MLALLLLLSSTGVPLELAPPAPAANFLEAFELPGKARLRFGRGQETATAAKAAPGVVVRPGSAKSSSAAKPECSIRVLPADPSLHPGSVRDTNPPVDAEMAVRSQCAP